MPQSRKRPGHRYEKPADIPASQRTKGRIVWALLFAVFGFLITFFASNNYIVPTVGAIAGAVIGYYTGKAMEKERSNT
jgi:hypothetical protein